MSQYELDETCVSVYDLKMADFILICTDLPHY